MRSKEDSVINMSKTKDYLNSLTSGIPTGYDIIDGYSTANALPIKSTVAPYKGFTTWNSTQGHVPYIRINTPTGVTDFEQFKVLVKDLIFYEGDNFINGEAFEELLKDYLRYQNEKVDQLLEKVKEIEEGVYTKKSVENVLDKLETVIEQLLLVQYNNANVTNEGLRNFNNSLSNLIKEVKENFKKLSEESI